LQQQQLSTTQLDNSNSIEFVKQKESPPFDKILIANRGEIAVRIMRTCKEMGISTVAIHSEADAGGYFVRCADESICIGPAASSESYLQIERIVNAVKMTGSQAVHPGFGFLSENNDFAAALERENVVFIGPRSYAIEVMGDKIKSKETALAAGVNCIPGDNRVISDVDECVQVANNVGYPVMVKASAGGGGKGMRIAYNDNECRDAFRLATNEAISSFGDDRLFVEKFIEEPRHIEIQVLADKYKNYLYLNERECSIQRRNQKVYEEAPSVVVTDKLRETMGKQACDLAAHVDYITAGTCEFLVDKNLDFYFLEMNTRLQVEHPVTEYITGIDLVKEMINVAAGKKLPYKQSDIGINGWAIEARVYAEDPFKGFLPQIGILKNYREPFPDNPNIRTDTGIQEGAEISVHYDPMISKLIVHGADRTEALNLMRDSLDSYVIHGLNHNIPFLRSILDHEKFINGNITTKFIEEEYPGGFSMDYINITNDDYDFLITTVASIYCQLRRDLIGNIDKLCIELKNNVYNIDIDGDNFILNDKKFNVSTNYNIGDFVFESTVNNKSAICQLISANNEHEIILQYKGLKHLFNLRIPSENELFQFVPKPEVIDLDRVLLAPMPGNIFSINVKVGQQVVAGQEACIIEAMKMQNIFYVQKDGIVKNVYVKQGDAVAAEQKIYEIE